MENIFLGKSNPEKTIEEHTKDLLRQYFILKQWYPNILENLEWFLLEEAIKYHDIGKINTKFQNKLYHSLRYDLLEDNYEEEKEVPHNILSTFFIDSKQYREKYGLENAQILVNAVRNHHDRKNVEYEEEHMISDLKKQWKALGVFLDLDIQNIKPCSARYILREDNLEHINILKSKRYILIKGLLNKLDYVASLDEDGVNVEEESRQNGQTIQEIVVKLIRDNFSGQFRPVQKYMLKYCEENLVVCSPTGSGKTEACLLWIGESKAFYTLPLKVSINSIYERILKQIGYSKALLLHSDAMAYYKENGNDESSYERAKRMSAPLLVTTVDQLFRIAFRYKGYEEILATLSYSKIIIDEIQMYSPELLAYILLGLKMVTEIGGKFAIVTATFPPLLYQLMDNLEIPYKKQEEAFIPNIEKRHKIKVLKNTQMDVEFIREKARNKKVLVIVNTIKKAQELYEQLKGESVSILHSQFLKSDRDKLEKSILEFSDRSKNSKNGIWISTQIVEASLDIDFDILFTDMCTIDSLFQRMGRVYRKRSYNLEEPNVYIYDNRNGGPKVLDFQIYRYSLDEILKYDNQLITEEQKQEMIENIFDLKKNPELEKSNYYNKILHKIQLLQDAIPNELSKKEIQESFRDIQSILLIPDNIYEKLENEGKIEEWKVRLSQKLSYAKREEIREEIKSYTISVTWSYGLEYDKEELFYKNSNIHRTIYQYEFDKEELKGRGLLKQSKKNDNFDD